MGKEHTKNDKIIRRQDIIEMEETLNGHASAWANIWNSGRDHNHFERIVASKTTHSENVADLYLMYKDHKIGDKTRPTATGCSSNTLGLSNAVAEILESVSNAEPKRYNCISSEDLLARIHSCNNKIRARNKLRIEAVVRKLQCKHCKIMEMVDCINTELHDWDTLQNPATSQGVPEPWNPENEQDEQIPKPLASQGVPEPWEPSYSVTEEKFQAAIALTNQECCGFDIKQIIQENCNLCGPGITSKEELCLIGNDVKALFPSITSQNTGKIIREAIKNTSLEFEGFCQDKALAYIAMNSELTSDLEEIAHLLPSRKSGRDTKLKMSAVKQDWNPQDKFVFQNQIISRSDKINLIARVIEIATRALFQNHAYKFGDEYFHQISGGSIGDRWTGAAAEVVMMDWSKKYQNILENSGIEVLLLSGYVDDGRQLSTSLPMGSRFNPTTRKFEITEQAEAEDKINKINGESTNQRMAKTCLSAMNSINSDLEFTVESPEDFENEQLPTLDFKIWQEQDNTINHCYYQKPVKTPYVIMARSSMATQQKIQILANELTRRISNINMKNSTQEQYNQVVNQFTQELKNSEYQHRTAREIVISGIRGLKTRIFRRESKKQEFYREAHKTAGVRARKKLVSKENWYKTQDNQDPANSTATRIARQELPRSLQKGGNKKPNKETESKIKAVANMPHLHQEVNLQNYSERMKKS